MGDVLECPPAGKRVQIARDARETGGEFVRFEMWLEADSRGPYLHVHPLQDEVLEVVSGTLGVTVDGETELLAAGERVEIPRTVPHRFWNEADAETHLYGELRPARRADEFLPLTFALAKDGWATRGGVPLNLLAVAAVFDEYEDYYYFARIPVSLQKVGIGLLAPLARRLGYRPTPEELPAVPTNEPAPDQDSEDERSLSR